ncbi:MAG TPA: hypothetical protein VN578_01545, partial [Candidatus Binatia bacterium]|nr:hypothetical protein [Candidatus Binatia bacterium]
MISLSVDSPAGPLVSTESPVAFFTNVASRLLQSELNLDLNYISIYPTNQYTPAVHRLLQVTANLYDAATNRTYGVSTASNGFPTVFRPLFRRDPAGGQIVIAGYREVTNADLAYAATTPSLVDLDSGQNTNTIPLLGTPFDPSDQNEPLVAGIPLVIGARKGFPNFNEFEMQTQVQICRKLEFLKHDALDAQPYQTNQMYLLSISNAFGVEAWNSYSNIYPRDLQMVVVADMTEGITDESGQPVPVFDSNSGSTTASNRVIRFTPPPALVIPSNTWAGFDDLRHPQYAKYSFQTPFLPSSNGGFFFFQTNCSYSQVQRQFIVPFQTSFETGAGFPVPRWWLNLKTRFRFIMVDTEANRIVDYVSLVSADGPEDLTTAITSGAHCGTDQRYVQDAFIGSMWCTNQLVTDPPTAPTYGIFNQIGVCLGTNTANLNWNGYSIQYPFDRVGAMNFFRTNLLRWLPLLGSSTQPFLTNHFYAPFAPVRNIYLYRSW